MAEGPVQFGAQYEGEIVAPDMHRLQQPPTEETGENTNQQLIVNGVNVPTMPINVVPDDDDEIEPLLGPRNTRSISRRTCIIICVIVISIVFVLSAVFPITLATMHRPPLPVNTTLIEVDNPAKQFLWVANVSTPWYNSIGITLFGIVSPSIFTVYSTTLSWLQFTYNTYNETKKNEKVSIHEPTYNVSLQKVYIMAGTSFTYSYCAIEPSIPINVGVHLFKIGNKSDEEAFLATYLEKGNSSLAIETTNVTVHPTKSGCATINTTISASAVYYAVTSLSNFSNLVLVTVNFSLTMQVVEPDDSWTTQMCTIKYSGDQCSITLASSNTHGQNFAVFINNITDTNLQNVTLQVSINKNYTLVMYGSIITLAVILITIVVVIIIGKCVYNTL